MLFFYFLFLKVSYLYPSFGHLFIHYRFRTTNPEFLFCIFFLYYSGILFSSYVYIIIFSFSFIQLMLLRELVFWNSIHLEVASDSFCFLINSSWLLVFILYVFFLIFSGFNQKIWSLINNLLSCFSSISCFWRSLICILLLDIFSFIIGLEPQIQNFFFVFSFFIILEFYFLLMCILLSSPFPSSN